MPVSPSEAQETLRDISSTSHASAKSYGYRVASPHFILWGIIWLLAWSVSYFDTRQSWSWPIFDVIGIAGSFLLGRRAARKRDGWAGQGGWGFKYCASLVAVAAFVAAVFAVMPPPTYLQAGAFFPLLVALFYCLSGIWARAARLWIIGVALAALTLAGYFWMPQIFLLWMALVGGGSLILAGVWLRSA